MLQKSPFYAYIPAKDVARARRFYEGTLGFHPKQNLAGGVVYEFGDHTACFLYPTPNAGTSRASQAFWHVDDVEREGAELKARGVEFEDYDMPGVESASGVGAGGGREVAELKARGVEFEDYDMPGEKSPSGVVTGGGAKAAWFKDSEGNILAI